MYIRFQILFLNGSMLPMCYEQNSRLSNIFFQFNQVLGSVQTIDSCRGVNYNYADVKTLPHQV